MNLEENRAIQEFRDWCVEMFADSPRNIADHEIEPTEIDPVEVSTSHAVDIFLKLHSRWLPHKTAILRQAYHEMGDTLEMDYTAWQRVEAVTER